MRRQDEFPRPADIWAYYVRSDRALAELPKLLYRHLREAGSGSSPVTGFAGMDREDGRPTRQRWQVGRVDQVTIDFLIAPSLPADFGGGP